MGSDDELPDDEEEILVYVEFEGLGDGNVFSEEQLQLDMIGIDSEHPIMQINGRFYEGTYEDISGTCMFFTRDDNSTVNDPVFDTASNLRYLAVTRKSLKMQRIFIKSRTEFVGDSEHHQCVPNLNTLIQAGVPLQYHEQALSFWNTMRNNRLNALHSYLEKQRIRQQKRSQGIMPESESDEDNPFAIYKDKEESDSVNKSKDIQVQLEKESSRNNSQLNSKLTSSIDNKVQTSDITENTYRDNVKESMTLIESQSPVLENNSQSSVRSVKTCKTKASRKKHTGITHNVRRIKCRIKQNSSKGKTVLPKATRRKESPSEENQLKEFDKCSVIKTSTSLEITKNENERTSEDRETTVIEESKVETNQIDSINSKIMKQRKREAKMKEISEQLKAIAEETLNTNIN